MARLPEWAERVADGRVTEGVRNAILGMGEAARETLLRIAVSPSYRRGSDEGRRRGPAEAIGLLAAMPYDDGTTRRLVRSLIDGPGDDEAPEIAAALCSFGAPQVPQQVAQLIPHLVEGLGATDDARAGEWIAELLVHVGRGDERVLPALVAALPRFPGEAALALGRLGDPHAILPLRGAFAAHRAGGEPTGFRDLDAVAVATAIEILGGELSTAERRKRDESERRGRGEVLKSLDRAREAVRAGEAELRALRDPGPNDPCPCGSGRKFKRCHEGDEAFRRAAEEAFPGEGDAG